jgi:hypothetical protein
MDAFAGDDRFEAASDWGMRCGWYADRPYCVLLLSAHKLDDVVGIVFDAAWEWGTIGVLVVNC